MKCLLLLLAVPACLAVPDGPTPECKVTSDCDTANGEVCDEGVCWGNPPPGPFAAVLTPPSKRKNDLVSRELQLELIPADGYLGELQLEEPVTYSGTIRAVCPIDCADKATGEATIIVTRPSPAFFPNGLGYRQVFTVEASAGGAFNLVLPSARPEDPYTITIVPGGRDDEPMGITMAQLVPPLRAELRVADTDPNTMLDFALGETAPTIDGVIKNAVGNALADYRVVALGRWDASSPLTEVSTVDYTGSDGTFSLRLSDGLLANSTVEIVAKPFKRLAPTLHMNVSLTSGAITGRVLIAPNTGEPSEVRVAITGADTGGEISGVVGARVLVAGVIPAQPGATITTFTAEATTGEDGLATLNLLDGAALAATYRISVVPPANANVGVVFDEPFVFGDSKILPDRVALVGQVQDITGTPLEDVQVTVRPSLRFQWSLDTAAQAFITAIPAATKVTPESGEYVIYVDALLDETFGHYDISFEPTANANAPTWTEFDIEIPRDTTQSSVPLPDIRLPDAAHVRGQITDSQGVAVEGAELRLFSVVDATAALNLCEQVPNPPMSCPIPARLLGRGASDDAGTVRLTLPRP